MKKFLDEVPSSADFFDLYQLTGPGGMMIKHIVRNSFIMQ